MLLFMTQNKLQLLYNFATAKKEEEEQKVSLPSLVSFFFSLKASGSYASSDADVSGLNSRNLPLENCCCSPLIRKCIKE